uniref:Major facilitator superfamily (MFS) profile domain-containing protein n=1 Tax=Solanum lycopersicum TaxID=4081 RepID=A0A3Q7GJ21_SOLLC
MKRTLLIEIVMVMIKLKNNLTLILINFAAIMEMADETLLPGVYKEVGKDLRIDPAGLGSLSLYRSLVQCLCYPLAAFLAARHNCANDIALGAFLWSGAMFLVAIYSTFAEIAISRGLNGIGLAIVKPAILSLVADSTHETNRGTAFGWLSLTGCCGAIISGTVIAETSFVGIPDVNANDQPSPKPFQEQLRELLKEAKGVIEVPSFKIIVAQGFFGSFHGTSLRFTTMWLELVGFSHKTTALISTFFVVSMSIGAVFGGFMGDVWA